LNLNDIFSLSEVIIQDFFALKNIPGGFSASLLLQRVFDKKAFQAREILFEAIKQGGLPDIDKDDYVFILYRYLRAAQEGAARINLCLLAEVISGKAGSRKLTSDKFLYYADLIASLTDEEILLLGVMVREEETSSYGALEHLELYFTREEQQRIFQSLIRTGLVMSEQDISVEDQDDWKNTYEKYVSKINTTYYLTSLMEEISMFIPFDKALKEEDIL